MRKGGFNDEKNFLALFFCAVALICGVFLMAACDSGQTEQEKTSETYTCNFDSQAVVTNNGLCAGITQARGEIFGMVQEDTLVLNSDGTYTLTKVMRSTVFPEGSIMTEHINVKYTFNGTYVQYENIVTLNSPTEGTADVDWGTIANSVPDAKDSEGVFNSTDNPEILSMFTTGFFSANSSSSSMQVTISVSDKTFSFN